MKQSIEWSEDLLVHVPAIDEQHKELYASMGALLDAVKEEQQAAALQALIEAVHEHTESHCEDEEALMLRFAYPGFEPQKKDHDYFTRSIASLGADFRGGTLEVDTLAADLAKLAEFFSTHIRKLDVPLGRFISESPAGAE